MRRTSTAALLVVAGSALVLDVPHRVLAQQDAERSEACEKGLERCVAEKRQEWADRGTLGMLILPLEDDDVIARGARWKVHVVMPGGAAEKAGVLANDLLVEWLGEVVPLDSPKYLDDALEAVRVGDKLTIGVVREGEPRTMTLVARKPSEDAIEYWLLFYVHQNFDNATFKKYQAEVEVRLNRPQRK